MISRLLFAAAGAAAITIGLFLLMDDVTSRYLLRDSTRYFRITDYIPAPDRGRRLPDLPVAPGVAPERPRFEHQEGEEPHGGERGGDARDDEGGAEVWRWDLPAEAAPDPAEPSLPE